MHRAGLRALGKSENPSVPTATVQDRLHVGVYSYGSLADLKALFSY